MVWAATVVKLLIFGHKPPPHHGQSAMIQLLLDVLQSKNGSSATTPPAYDSNGDLSAQIEFCHVDARFSDDIAAIGRVGIRKLLLVFRYVFQAWRHRVWHGADCFYFMPANAARVPIYRDWIILGLCRPCFRKTIYHWQAHGLGEWLERTARPWERWISQRVYGHPDLSIILRSSNARDAEVVHSKRIAVVPNAIADPCPDFDSSLLPRHLARQRVRRRILAGNQPDAADLEPAGPAPTTYKILYIGLCHREKGLFDAVEAVRLAGQRLAKQFRAPHSPFQIQLTVAGEFWQDEDRRRFEELIRHPDLSPEGFAWIEYVGFAGGDKKRRLFRESDCLVFPTYYGAESFGIVLVEGMAHGLALIASRWRGLHDLLPEGYPGTVEPRQPEQITAAIMEGLTRDYDPGLRQHFLKEYTAGVFARRMRKALAETGH